MKSDIPISALPARGNGAEPIDRHGRRIDYLRISVTDRCNLRCVYCMPTHAIPFVPSSELLTAAEIESVVRGAASLGFRKIRLTGGEPTLRSDILEIVERIASVPGIADLAMTTNAVRMRSLAAPLRAAGLRRVNIHIDTLNPDRLPRIMRWGTLDDLWSGLEACEAAGLAPMKLNAVIARGYNDEDVVDLARLTLARPWTVRFIELMPLGSGDEAQVAVDRYVSSDEVAERIRGALGELAPRSGSDPADEAQYFTLPGAAGTIGFISPVSAPYCGTCNRMRLTADGRFHLCLLHDQEIDVRSVLRAGGDADSVRATLLEAIRRKPVGHSLDRGVHTMDRRMHALGG